MSAILQRDARNARVYGHIFALTGTGESEFIPLRHAVANALHSPE